MYIYIYIHVYGELVAGSRHAGRPKLRFKDVCKRDMKRCNIDSNSWESIADDRPSWRQTVKQGAKFAEEALTTAALDKRSRRKERGKISPGSQLLFSPSPDVAEIATHELVCTAIQGSADRLKLWRYTIVSRDGRMPPPTIYMYTEYIMEYNIMAQPRGLTRSL